MANSAVPDSSQQETASLGRSNDSHTAAPRLVPAREFLDLTKDVRDGSAIQLLREILTTARKIVVIAGAGISVAAGIPDFRSSKGIFATMKAKGRAGQAMFDSSVYRSPQTLSEFHEMTCTLYEASQNTRPTPFHDLLATLAKSDRLLRLYTQNIDFLDTRLETLNTTVPVPATGPWPKTIAVHGSLAKMTCTKCKVIKDFNPKLFRIWKEDTPECVDCKKDEEARIAAGRRKLGVGFIRPRMVLYGEPGYDDINIGSCMASDLRNRPDTLIVVGTTLKIPGTRTMVKEMSKAIGNRGHVIWLNIDDAPSGEFDDLWDFVIKGDCQEVAHLMDNITITHKDESFRAEELIPASQQTERDTEQTNSECTGRYWSVVEGDTVTGMPTPPTTVASCSDDEKSIKSQLSIKRLLQPNTITNAPRTDNKFAPETTKTEDFYAPLAGAKANSLKRKRSRIQGKRSSTTKPIKVTKPSPATNTTLAVSTKTSKKKETKNISKNISNGPTHKKKKTCSKPGHVVKLKLSPRAIRIINNMSLLESSASPVPDGVTGPALHCLQLDVVTTEHEADVATDAVPAWAVASDPPAIPPAESTAATQMIGPLPLQSAPIKLESLSVQQAKVSSSLVHPNSIGALDSSLKKGRRKRADSQMSSTSSRRSSRRLNPNREQEPDTPSVTLGLHDTTATLIPDLTSTKHSQEQPHTESPPSSTDTSQVPQSTRKRTNKWLTSEPLRRSSRRSLTSLAASDGTSH